MVAGKQGKKRKRVAGDARKLPDGDAERNLDSWVEAESLKRCEANYCTLVPPPRSTIAAAFSHDGMYLASTQYVKRARKRRDRHLGWTMDETLTLA